MRVTKVNEYKMVRDTKEGYLLNKNNHEIRKENEFKEIEHILSQTILNKAFEKGIYGEKRVISPNKKEKKELEKIEEINKKRKAIGNFVSKLKIDKDNKLIFQDDTEKLRENIKEIALCDYPKTDQYGELTKEKIISYSFKKKALLQFDMHVFITKLVDKSCNKEINTDDFESLYQEIIVPKLKAHDEKIKQLYKSIKNNKIKVKGNENKSEFYIRYKDNKININDLAVTYQLDRLVNDVKIVHKNEGFNKLKYYEKNSKNSKIKKILQTHQMHLMADGKFYDVYKKKTDLKYYDDEIVAYFHRHFPVKRKPKTINFNCEKIEYLDEKKINKEVFFQIKNKMLTHFITKGKYLHYAITHSKNINYLKSKDLQTMHIEDVFSRKLSSTITYAVNGFRNEVFGKYTLHCIDKLKEEIQFLQSNQDFLLNGKDNYLKEKNVYVFNKLENLNLLGKYNIDNAHSSDISNIISKLYEFTRNSMYAFRNTSFHYQNIKTKFLTGKEKEIQYFKYHINIKVARIPEIEVMKAYDNGVYHFFNHKTILDLYHEDNLYIPRDNIKMPQFKKVMNVAKRVEKFFSVKISDSINNNINKIEDFTIYQEGKELSRRQAVRYLLLKVYHAHAVKIKIEALKALDEYLIRKKVLDSDDDSFKAIKAINNIIKKEKKENHFEDLIEAIQADREKYEEEKWKECKLAYDFINELTAVAFLKILNQEKYNFIFINNQPVKCCKEEVKDQFNKHLVSQKTLKELQIIHEDQDDLFYAFYSMLLFLSKARLSELNNNIATYKQAIQKIDPINQSANYIFRKIKIDSVEKVIRILMTTYENEEIDEDRYNYLLKYFLQYKKLEELEEYNPKDPKEGERQQFYIQRDKKDGNNKKQSRLIKFGQIIEADREDLIGRYKKYYKNKGKIMSKETLKLCELEIDIPNVIEKLENIKIAIQQFEKEKHGNKKKYNKKTSREKNKILSKKIDQGKEYTKQLYKRKAYDLLKNHVLFTNVSKMNRLLVDLYSRLNGLLAVAEKDLKYLYYGIEGKEFKGNDIWKHFMINNEVLKIEDKTVRNKIAHFEYMRKTECVKEVTFIEQLNMLRKLLDFDRKLKNAVTKTVINTFDKHGFELAFAFENHKIVSYDLKRKTLTDIYLDINYYEELQKELIYKDYFLEMIKEIIFNGKDVDNSISKEKLIKRRKNKG